jgi:hypothetical protein
VEESLVILLIHTIFHILPIGKGIAIDAVIEADGWRAIWFSERTGKDQSSGRASGMARN